MVVKTAIAGANGFDVNQQLSAMEADAFVKNGMAFVLRYFPRTPALISGNLTALELQILLTAGLAVGAVQHCPLSRWYPNAGLGTQYGNYAVTYGKSIGYPLGAPIYLDLETPASGCTAQDCIDYAEAWFTAVQGGGYLPCVYLGYGLPMTPKQFYDLAIVKNYWRAYNGPDVATRGYQLIQETEETLNGIQYDPNKCVADEKGDLPIFIFSS